jgi:transketolase
MADTTKLNLKGELAPKSLRQQFGFVLKEMGKIRKNLVVLDADLSSSTNTKAFGESFPDRFFNVGIAEENLIGIANGLACSNKIPIVSGFTCFTIGRAWEFIRTAAYDHLPLKICTTHAGISNGKDGGSHQSVEDLSLIAAMPGTTIFCPSDPIELEQMLPYIVDQPGVCFLRMYRDALPWVWTKEFKFSADQPRLLYESNPDSVDITICSTGSMTCFTPQLILDLEKQNYSIRILHFGIMKPIAQAEIDKWMVKTKTVVTLEEHNIIAGFGAQLSRCIALYNPHPVLTLGINDQFGQSGNLDELYEEYQLTPKQILVQIQNWMKKTH